MKWVEIRVECPVEASEAVCALLARECGGVAVSEGGALVSGWITMDDRVEARLLAMRSALDGVDPTLLADGLPEMTVCPAQEGDWAMAWREFFHPFAIAGRFIIRPPWEQAAPGLLPEAGADPVELIVEPGMAFGTGQHPTTELMLRALAERPLDGLDVVDVGAGSAILSIAAAKLGARRVAAYEIDPAAEENARLNIAHNGVGQTVDYHVRDGMDPADAPFDLALMNIVADVIRRLAPSVWENLKPGGLLICSGVIDDREEEMADFLQGLGFLLERRRTLAEWRSFECRKPEGIRP